MDLLDLFDAPWDKGKPVEKGAHNLVGKIKSVWHKILLHLGWCSTFQCGCKNHPVLPKVLLPHNMGA